MVDDENFDELYASEDDGVAVPLCLECMEPVDPSDYYCANCGQASNKFTQYIPFVNIQWIVHFWVKMWEQVWSREVSVLGRIFRLLMIVWFFPLVLVVMPFKRKTKTDDDQRAADSEEN